MFIWQRTGGLPIYRNNNCLWCIALYVVLVLMPSTKGILDELPKQEASKHLPYLVDPNMAKKGGREQMIIIVIIITDTGRRYYLTLLSSIQINASTQQQQFSKSGKKKKRQSIEGGGGGTVNNVSLLLFCPDSMQRSICSILLWTTGIERGACANVTSHGHRRSFPGRLFSPPPLPPGMHAKPRTGARQKEEDSSFSKAPLGLAWLARLLRRKKGDGAHIRTW